MFVLQEEPHKAHNSKWSNVQSVQNLQEEPHKATRMTRWLRKTVEKAQVGWDYWYLSHYPILIGIIDTFLIIPFRLGYLYLSHYLSLRFPSPFDIDNDVQRELFIMQSYANAETQARQKI